jgi:hypothetical protein
MATEQDQISTSPTNDEGADVGFSTDDFSDLMGIEEEPASGTDTDVDDDKGEPPVVDQQDEPDGTDDQKNDQDLDENSKEYWENRARLMEAQLAEAYKKTPAEPVQPEEDKPIEGDSFFGEWKFEDIIENEDSFKKFLGEFAGKVKNVTKEAILKDLPQTVTKLTSEQMETRRIVTEFYDGNKELQTVKPFVAQITNQVASEHPDWTLDKVLEETAVRSYKALGLKKKVEDESARKQKKPAFVDTTRNRRGNPDPQKSKLEKELEELMELE